MSDDSGGNEQSFMGRMAQSARSALRGAVVPPIAGLKDTEESIKSLNKALDDLQRKMEEVNRKSTSITSNITSMLGALQKNATTAATAVTSLSTAVGQMGSSTGSTGGPSVNIGSTAQPSQAIAAAGQSNTMRSRFTTSLTSALGSNIFKDIAMFPLRFMRDQLSNSRELALQTSMAMGGQAFATGTTTQEMMRTMAGMPGNVLGSPEDLMALMSTSRQAGAMLDFSRLGGYTMYGRPRPGLDQYTPRARGFFEGVRQMQAMTPGEPVAALATTLGSFSANTGAQQQAQFLTGGAFAMIGQGGRQKTVSEWAESILRWLEHMRPGRFRDKPFDYGQLMSQYFPGSNIDAWFAANNVPQNMREYWWTYALGKAKATHTTQGGEFPVNPQENDLAFQRLRSGTAQTISSYNLAGQLAGAYSNREQANRWFNEMMGQVLSDVIPAAMSQGPLRFAQVLPENIEELFMTLMEKTGAVGALMGGALGYGGLGGGLTMLRNIVGAGQGTTFGKLFDQASTITSDPASFLEQLTAAGDVGDVGDFGPLGGTTTAGLHPDMRRKVNKMMRANPALRVNSGLRDLGTQQKLARKGYSRVSGRASAHTRGMAADLGPASQYPWIVANAHRFGLKSGARQGEPWHVGIGDAHDEINRENPAQTGNATTGTAATGTGGTANINILEMFMDLIKGDNKTTMEDATATVGQLVPAFFNLLLGVMGRYGSSKVEPGSQAYEDLKFRPGQFAALVAASKDYLKVGGLVPSLAGGGGGGPTPTPPGGPTDNSAFASTDKMTRARATARVAHDVGFRNPQLWQMVAIAGRESEWTPSSINQINLHDTGLFQINWPNSAGGRSQESLKDPLTNAQAAWQLSSHGANLSGPWGVSAETGNWNGSSNYLGYTNRPWGASPQSGSDVGSAKAQAAVNAEGLGDVDYYMAPRPRIATGTQTVFNNSFIIQGGSGPNMGIDARRVASLLANHLEEEMRQRMARHN